MCRHALVAVSRSLLAKEGHESEGSGGGVGDNCQTQQREQGPPCRDGDGGVGDVADEGLGSPVVAPRPRSSDDDVQVDSQSTDNVTHVSLTLGLWGSTVLIAVLFRDLRIVLALTGALAA